MALETGKELDWYGSEYLRLITNSGTLATQLDLPSSNNLIWIHYKVLKAFKVATGIVEKTVEMQNFTLSLIKILVSFGYLAML